VTGAALLAIALSGPLGGPAPPAAFHVSGRGWGHGVGLAQYGAMGYAREEQRGHRWILEHYFPGTGLREAAGGRIRVRLRERPAARVSGSTRARAADGRRIRLRARSTYRFAAAEGDRVAVTDAATGSLRARLHGPVRLTGARPLRLLGVAENGRKDGDYRGTLVLHRTASGVLVIDDVGVERYLDAVVPAEMPAAWPAGALRAQSVAARSYARTSLVPDGVFDVHADTRSQVYGGVEAEHPRTTAAVRATRRTIVVYAGRPARTLFHSSSGGRTAASEEVFGGDAIAYLRSVEDPYDRLSPHHAWERTLTREQVAERLSLLALDGDLLDVAVTARTPAGRVASLTITTTAATTVLDASRARSLLGLRSTWFSIAPAIAGVSRPYAQRCTVDSAPRPCPPAGPAGQAPRPWTLSGRPREER
jgi:stage II sporulation protein D